jgi:hypothetical protein
MHLKISDFTYPEGEEEWKYVLYLGQPYTYFPNALFAYTPHS